jgi:glutamate-1-semialdehyde 2,1-aminomutase
MNSVELFQKAEKYFIAGTSAAGRFHGALRRPLYLQKADGSHLYDIDGREFIDYNNSAGAAFFGYNHPRLREAVERSLEMGFFMNFESEYHQELAGMLCEVIPSAEKVRLSNTGTEVTMGGIRLARVFTGKEKIIKFEGHFHGMHECIFYNHGALGEKDLHGEIQPLPDSSGFPKSFAEPMIVLEFNNVEALEHALRKYRGEVAAVIMEPISFNCGCMPAKKEYLQQVRRLCDKEEVVLIFDEVLSGFRMALGGGQEYYGVTPDLTTLAKALGGGFPISALVGKEEIMKHLNPGGSTVMSGTYTGSLMPVLVAIECLKMMKEPGFYESLNGRAEKLYRGVNRLFEAYRIPGHVRGIGARFATFFGIEDEEYDFDFRKIAETFDGATYREFIKKALDHGLHFHIEGWSAGGVSLPTHCGITSAHTDDDITITLEKIKSIFEELATTRAPH